MPNQGIAPVETEAVQRAFSKQAIHYDALDQANPVLSAWREQVYSHVDQFLAPNRYILELNSGTGIDALRFVNAGHFVHATDIADGMIDEIRSKVHQHRLGNRLTCQRCSFEHLQEVDKRNFDYVFSNFGGLNCSRDLRNITRQLPDLLNPGAYITWVIMPKISPWELLWIFRGRFKMALRRFQRDGAPAHVEGETFTTYYHSLQDIRTALGPRFRLLRVEGLGAACPPPSSTRFIAKYPVLHHVLKNLDRFVRTRFPLNRWADHIIVTFQFMGK